MRVRLDRSALAEAKWSPYALRFLFGGFVTAAAGLVAQHYGPVIGGLLLAFPAIFSRERDTYRKTRKKQEKEKRGMSGTVRGRQAASVDAAGSAMGSLGLILFAVIVWRFLPGHRTWAVLSGATAAWAVASVSAWQIRKHAPIMRRRIHVASGADHA